MSIEKMEQETMQISETEKKQKTPQEKLKELDYAFFEARDKMINNEPEKEGEKSHLDVMREIFEKIKEIYLQQMEKKE